ncbi:MAG: HAD-IC family P-type ATPase, partial [Pirellulales bacterium]|nr:HAD-IC family P-type ATPase [Pirellulales bacterium]
SAVLLADRQIALGDELAGHLPRLAAEGLTPVLIAVDGACVALAALGDELRADALPSVEALRALGWDVGILSGDHPLLVERVAREVGVDIAAARGGLSPEDKLAAVREYPAEQCVVMVGDGVNDSAALAAATVGVAVHGGAEVSLQAATVYLSRGELSGLVDLVRAARRTLRAIYRNFAASLGYNALAVGLAACGAIDPLIAAILMPISSLTVVSLSLGARTFEDSR